MGLTSYPFRLGTVTPTATMTGWLNSLPWAVYNVTPATRTDGQGGPIEANSTGQLLVDVRAMIPGVGATNLGKAEDAAHASGDTGVMALAVQKATPADLGADGDYGPLQVSAGRMWASSLVTDLVPGVGATNLGKAEDAAHSSGDTGVMALAVQKATPVDLGADGDYGPLQVSAGRVWTNSLLSDGTNAVAVETAGADAGSNMNNALSTKARLVGFNGTTWDRLRTATVTPTATMTGWLNNLPWAVYNATPTVRTEGQGGPLQANVNGAAHVAEQLAAAAEDNTNSVLAVADKPLAVSTYSYTRFQNLGANTNLNVKASAGNVFSLSVHNTIGSAIYFGLYNTATVPAEDSTVPLFTFLVPANTQIVIGTDFFGSQGMNFSSGIAFGISDSEGVFNAGARAATDHVTQICYK